MKRRCLTAALALAMVAYLHAAGAGGPARRGPATATATGSQPTATAPTASPAAMKVLRRLEAAGARFPALQADLSYRVELTDIGDQEAFRGKVYYQAAAGKSPAKFRIHFDKFRQGRGPWRKAVEDYVFDGQWFTLRKERTKQHHKFQVAPPGSQVDALQLGRGPFPVPFGQKAADVVRYFRATTRPAGRFDPPGTDRLRLVVRPSHKRQMKVAWIELWVRRDTGLPVKLTAEDLSENVTTAIFGNIKTPKRLPKRTFDLPRPPLGWEVRVEPYRGRIGR